MGYKYGRNDICKTKGCGFKARVNGFCTYCEQKNWLKNNRDYHRKYQQRKREVFKMKKIVKCLEN